MQSILAVTFPFFGLVLVGWVLARIRLMTRPRLAWLNKFILYLALPCMLFRFAQQTPFEQIFNLHYFFGYAVTGIIVAAIFILADRVLFHEPALEAGFAGYAAAHGNVGYLGLPLVVGLIGASSASYVILAIMADLLIVSSLCLAVSASGGGARGHLRAGADTTNGPGPLETFFNALRGAISNPLPWAVGVGAAASALSIALPGPVDFVVKPLAFVAGPCALVAIGASLVRDQKGSLTDAWWISYGKLLVHPFIAAVLAKFVFGFSRPELEAAVLCAALPVAGSIFIFAERRGANAERVSHAILVSTASAFITFSFVVWAMGIRPA
jgi:hypothetical protein